MILRLPSGIEFWIEKMKEVIKFMAKALYISEKPSVAQEFAKALKLDMKSFDGYKEGENAIVTWCVGHLVTMSYPEKYDEKYKKWSLATLPFIPSSFQYEVIPSVKKQYKIVEGLLNRKDVDMIYICTDSGREGEYIYRLVDQMANVDKQKARKRVWIDSQTEEEILRGIREAKDWKEYDTLSDAAYLRAKEDYLMGINFSRLLTLKYGNALANFLNQKYMVISVGRVMTCVLGMVVRKEREIREFVKTPFYRVLAKTDIKGKFIEAEWKAVEGSKYYQSPKLYKENGFKEKADAEDLIHDLSKTEPFLFQLLKIEKKKEKKNPPLLYNLAELQNDCSRFFKISPDETLKVVQELYEKKLVTYPRTDARVLSTAVSKEISKNISGLRNIPGMKDFAQEILDTGSFKNIAKTRYVNDKQITDHYAIVPTGQGFSTLKGLSKISVNVYEVIVRRFLAIFFPAAEYQKVSLNLGRFEEQFFANFKVLMEPGYLKVMEYSFFKKKEETTIQENANVKTQNNDNEEESDNADKPEEENVCDADFLELLVTLKKGDEFSIDSFFIKEGETSPPKRYNSGSMILAMENAGQLIDDEELRAQMKGSGIGTSATRAEILKKLVGNKYLALNKKTQIVIPTMTGEMIYDVVNASVRSLLNPELTASWEKGLTLVSEGSITAEEYMEKLTNFVQSRTSGVMALNNQYQLRTYFEYAQQFYKEKKK